jgi:four helix bundle protein
VNAGNENAKPYDLEERTAVLAEQSRAFVKRLQRTIANVEDARQFIRASGSIGANYIEANEAIGKRDFVMKFKICRRKPRKVAIGCGCLMSMGNSSKNASNSHLRRKSS